MSGGTRRQSPDQSKLDAALSNYLNSSSDEDFARLIPFGPAALDRVLTRYFHQSDADVPQLTSPLAIGGREAAEAWWGAVVGLGRAFPEEFLDLIDRDRVTLAEPLLVITTLGAIKGTRARSLLCRFANHPDDLVRYHVMNGLKWRDDEAAVVVVEEHLSDPSPLVRLESIRGVARRDPIRARPLLIAFGQDATVPPLLREEARRTLTTLAEGADRHQTS